MSDKENGKEPTWHLTGVGAKQWDKLATMDMREVETNLTEKVELKTAFALMEIQLMSQEVEVELNGKKFKVEVAHCDTRDQDKKSSNDPIIVNVTGGWGRGPEVHGEADVYSKAFGDRGMEMYAISLAGHGRSEKLKGPWGTFDFKKQTEIMAAYMTKIREGNPGRKIIANGWSMGGISVMKMAADFPDLVDGLVLMDTPAFPDTAIRLASKFMSYTGYRKDVEIESPAKVIHQAEGDNIFNERIKRAVTRKKEAIPFPVVFDTMMGLTRQDLLTDGTLEKLANNNIPILLMSGENDYVVPKDQMDKLATTLTTFRENNNGQVAPDGDSVEAEKRLKFARRTIAHAGHQLPVEQPTAIAKEVREWMINQQVIPTNYFKA